MAYTPTNWVNGVTPLNAQNMNKIENELLVNSNGIKSISMLPSDNIIEDFKTLDDFVEQGKLYFDAPDDGYIYIHFKDKNDTGGYIDYQYHNIASFYIRSSGTFNITIPVYSGATIGIHVDKSQLHNLHVSFVYANKGV